MPLPTCGGQKTALLSFSFYFDVGFEDQVEQRKLCDKHLYSLNQLAGPDFLNAYFGINVTLNKECVV